MNPSIRDNELNIIINLGILANIYHCYGDDIRALELAQRALILLERCASVDSLSLALLLNNIAAIQFGAGLFDDALSSIDREMFVSIPESKTQFSTIYLARVIKEILKMYFLLAELGHLTLYRC